MTDINVLFLKDRLHKLSFRQWVEQLMQRLMLTSCLTFPLGHLGCNNGLLLENHAISLNWERFWAQFWPCQGYPSHIASGRFVKLFHKSYANVGFSSIFDFYFDVAWEATMVILLRTSKSHCRRRRIHKRIQGSHIQVFERFKRLSWKRSGDSFGSTICVFTTDILTKCELQRGQTFLSIFNTFLDACK